MNVNDSDRTDNPTLERCEAKVWQPRGIRLYRCQNVGVVRRECWYCSTHDPVRIARRKDKNRAAERAEQERAAAARAEADHVSAENERRGSALAARLGCGTTARSTGPGGLFRGVAVDALTIRFDDVERLLERLETAESKVRGANRPDAAASGTKG